MQIFHATASREAGGCRRWCRQSKARWTSCPRVSPARAANATRVTGTSPRPPGLQTSDSTPGHSFQREILLPIFLSLFQAQHVRCRYLGTMGTLTHFSPWMELQSGGADRRPGRNAQFAAAPCFPGTACFAG